jgi:nicotinate-nucleotide adenylyltransferase
MNVGLFFGTFNPIHVGHLIIANYMANYTSLDQVWLVVSPHNPLKEKSTLLGDQHRLTLVRIAVEENSKLWASDIEFSMPQPSYTAKTLAVLKEKYPNNTFSLIMGEDNLRSFPKWYNYEKILDEYPIFVYPRLRTAAEENHSAVERILTHPNVHMCNDVPVMNLSASFIREGIKNKKDVRYLLTESVLTYIEEMHFYR